MLIDCYSIATNSTCHNLAIALGCAKAPKTTAAPSPSSSSSSSMAIGLGVGLGIGIPVIIALVLIGVLLYKGSKSKITPATKPVDVIVG